VTGDDALEDARNRWFGDEAEDERRDRDAELRRREVERQPSQREPGRAGPPVARRGERVDPVAIDGDERELGGDEERRGEDEGSDGAEAERGVQG
jgi:hypothetical protein